MCGCKKVIEPEVKVKILDKIKSIERTIKFLREKPNNEAFITRLNNEIRRLKQLI